MKKAVVWYTVCEESYSIQCGMTYTGELFAGIQKFYEGVDGCRIMCPSELLGHIYIYMYEGADGGVNACCVIVASRLVVLI